MNSGQFHFLPQPSVQFIEDALHLCKTEVIYPAPQFRDYLFHACPDVSSSTPSQGRDKTLYLDFFDLRHDK
jgi:hypothetical protein